MVKTSKLGEFVQWLIINLALIALFLSGCSASAPIAPSPASSFVGSLIVVSGGNIYELTSDSATKNVNDLRIAGPNVDYAALSPDKRQLVYSVYDQDDGETRLRNLQTGEETILFSTRSGCISWNEENDMLNYLRGFELYVYSLSTGQSTLVAIAPSAHYGVNAFSPDAGPPVYGAISCGAWIGPDRFLFSRYAGPMPSQIDSGTNIIPADTLTLAIIGETVNLIDSNQLYLEGVSADGTQILFEQNGETYLTPPFNDFESINPRLIPTDLRFGHLSFLPTGSDLFYTGVTAEGVHQIHYIDSKTLEDHLGPKLPANWPYWEDWIWVGDPKDNLFAVVEDSENGPFHISVIDLDTGGRIEIVERQLAEDLGSVFKTHILTWLPP